VEHLQHFGLNADPFRNEPLLSLFLATAPHRDALRRLERGVRQAKGLSLLVGEVGAGKTMVVRRLLESLEEDVFEASMLVVLNESADPGWMLRRFAAQLGVEAPAAEREALMAQLYDQLAVVREDGRHAVLIIDDAQALAAPRTRAELGALLKLEYEERRLLSVVLAGTPRLETALAADPILAHRVDVKVRLRPLDAESAAGYLAHRLARAGGRPEALDAGAVAALHELGRGLPGQMNTLADNALFEAFLCGRTRMTRVDVERAQRDLAWQGSGGEAAPPAEGPAAELDESLGDLDSELEAVFDEAAGGGRPGPLAPQRETRRPRPAPIELDSAPSRPLLDGPPKDEEADPPDLLVELLDD
jgi:type II secretory pathway predicted ATPase ExeA